VTDGTTIRHTTLPSTNETGPEKIARFAQRFFCILQKLFEFGYFLLKLTKAKKASIFGPRQLRSQEDHALAHFLLGIFEVLCNFLAVLLVKDVVKPDDCWLGKAVIEAKTRLSY
jgi:hypothetical protein